MHPLTISDRSSVVVLTHSLKACLNMNLLTAWTDKTPTNSPCTLPPRKWTIWAYTNLSTPYCSINDHNTSYGLKVSY